MLELVQAGGWLMLPIILCSIIAIAIIIERFWTLNAARIAPQNILAQVWLGLKMISWIQVNCSNYGCHHR